MGFFNRRGNNEYPRQPARQQDEVNWLVVQEDRNLVTDTWGALENELAELRGERDLRKMTRQLEAQVRVHELGTRLVESKQRLSLAALQAQADLRLQRLQVEAHVLQTEAALMETREHAREKLRKLKLAKLAEELGVPVNQLEALQKNGNKNSSDEEEDL